MTTFGLAGKHSRSYSGGGGATIVEGRKVVKTGNSVQESGMFFPFCWLLVFRMWVPTLQEVHFARERARAMACSRYVVYFADE